MSHHHKHESEKEEVKQEVEASEQETGEAEIPAAESVEDKTAELQAEVEKYKDLYIRSQAEMENLRRRTQQELEKRSKFAVSSFAQDLLPVNDNLSRAMAAIPEEGKENDLFKNLLVGLELTQKDLNAALEKNNITPIESVGRIFDPNLHKVAQEIDDPTKPAGMIVQEWQKGYMIGGDRVLREAVVVVAKGGPAPGQKQEEIHIDTSV
ncbi:MAG: nucleotide exchange factor GrpE [Alphaproteobacteria bacterium]|nr:nucleotide exchange factor GrpE [Alphaproteobacteria bacterium]MBO4643576.1 nucleotide exchange factor GrpE [Alphaproteobacteria bacterium]